MIKLSDANDALPPEVYALVAAKVEAAYREAYETMAKDCDTAWEASESKRGLDQAMKVARECQEGKK